MVSGSSRLPSTTTTKNASDCSWLIYAVLLLFTTFTTLATHLLCIPLLGNIRLYENPSYKRTRLEMSNSKTIEVQEDQTQQKHMYGQS